MESPGPYERMRRQVVRSVAWLLLIVAVVIGVIAAGRWSFNQLTTDDRFRTTLADVECETPPGLKRSEFLDEVKFFAVLTGLPDRFAVADVAMHDKVRATFKKHPWVLSVEEIESLPPARLRVKLVFRRPALAVPWQGDVRVVDDRGVLLPVRTSAKGLPLFAGAPNPPTDAGETWPDADVVRQALQR